MYFNKLHMTMLVLSCSLDGGLLTDLLKDINPCTWDQNTINECIVENLERQKLKLKNGIPELGLPSFNPFCIEEEIHPDIPGIMMTGRNVTITGVDDFILKRIHIDLDKYTIQLKLLFPKLHVEGEGMVETLILGFPIKGAGTFMADAIKTSTSSIMHFDIVERDGAEYLVIDKTTVDINIKDYELKMNGLFKDKVLKQTLDMMANQRREDMLRISKPYIESMVNKLLKNIVNNFVKNIPLDTLFKDRNN